MDILVYVGWDMVTAGRPYLAEIFIPTSEILNLVGEAREMGLEAKRSRSVGLIAEVACLSIRGDENSVQSFVKEHIEASYQTHYMEIKKSPSQGSEIIEGL